LGTEITTLINEEKPAGIYEVEFDATELSSGTYFYKLISGNFVSVKKMLLMK
ncbi:MAG: peptidase S8, partial [Ignavibacteriales bacterium UTCHB2]